MIISNNDLNEVRKQIQEIKRKNPSEEIIVRANDIEFNRKILEMKSIDILLSPEIHNRKDFLKQRDSGLNEVLVKLAAKNNIKIGINLDGIQKLEKKEKAIVLARIRQNITLCKRTKADIILFPQDKYNKLEVLSFFKSLGGSTEQVK
jgi:ribonuclease P/MRP protein subunit RPP1